MIFSGTVSCSSFSALKISYTLWIETGTTWRVSRLSCEGNRDYRFFIAGEDRKIYAYDRNGNVVTGWDFDRSEKIVKKPLQHFRVAGRDYIVFADENRPYILDRRGSERVKPGRFFSQAPNSTFTLDDSSPGASPRLVTTDSLGIVRFVYLNGKVEDLTLKKVSSNHVFDYLDINGDGRKDFTFLDGNHLYVYQNNRKFLFIQIPMLTKFSDYLSFGPKIC